VRTGLPRVWPMADRYSASDVDPQVFTTSGVVADFCWEGLASAGFVPSVGSFGGDTGASAGLSAMLSETVLGESVIVASQRLTYWVSLRPEWHCAATTVDAKDDRISNGAPFAASTTTLGRVVGKQIEGSEALDPRAHRQSLARSLRQWRRGNGPGQRRRIPVSARLRETTSGTVAWYD
jgi:hypothetical protein